MFRLFGLNGPNCRPLAGRALRTPFLFALFCQRCKDAPTLPFGFDFVSAGLDFGESKRSDVGGP
jgi:hypothetical protein